MSAGQLTNNVSDDGDGRHDDGDWLHDDGQHDNGKGQKEAASAPPTA